MFLRTKLQRRSRTKSRNRLGTWTRLGRRAGLSGRELAYKSSPSESTAPPADEKMSSRSRTTFSKSLSSESLSLSLSADAAASGAVDGAFDPREAQLTDASGKPYPGLQSSGMKLHGDDAASSAKIPMRSAERVTARWPDSPAPFPATRARSSRSRRRDGMPRWR